jgi:hypothetical protein
VVSDVKLEMSTTAHFCNNPSCSKPSHVPTKVRDLAMDELVNGIRELKLKLAKFEEKGQVLAEPTSKSKPEQTIRRMPLYCMCCDSFEHLQRDCGEFSIALLSDIVFFKEGRIYSRETGLLLETNFDKGGIKALMEGLSKGQASVKVEGSLYGIGLVCDCVDVSINLPSQSSALWTSAMKLVVSKELTKEKLHLVGNSICQTTCWDDLVDKMFVHAYIARSQHEAIVEEKRKRDEADEGSSKKANRANKAQ